jgi:hypothetical protein
MLTLKIPVNESEFEEMMRVVDNNLRTQQVPVHARPTQGWLAISSTLKAGLRYNTPPGQNPRQTLIAAMT